jgi:hypothetical protein
MCNTSNREGWLGSGWCGVVSGRVEGAFASRGGRENGCGRRRDVREGWSACYLAPHLWRGPITCRTECPLGGVEAEEP